MMWEGASAPPYQCFPATFTAAQGLNKLRCLETPSLGRAVRYRCASALDGSDRIVESGGTDSIQIQSNGAPLSGLAASDRGGGSGELLIHNHAFIDDRTVAHEPMNRFGKGCRRSRSVVEQPHFPEVALACQPESEQRILQSFGSELKERNLAHNGDAHVLVVNLIQRQPLHF